MKLLYKPNMYLLIVQ